MNENLQKFSFSDGFSFKYISIFSILGKLGAYENKYMDIHTQ